MKRSCKTCLYDLNFSNYLGYCDTCTDHCNYNSIIERAVSLLRECEGVEIVEIRPMSQMAKSPSPKVGDTVIIIPTERKGV